MAQNKSRILLVAALIAGIVGGVIGGYAAGHWQTDSTKSTISSGGTVTKDSVAIADVIKKVSPSVVSITVQGTTTNVFGQTTSTQAAGSGIVLSSDGLIMTNKHVADQVTANYSVITSNGTVYKNGKVLARDPYNDVAFIKVEARGLTPAKLSESTGVVVGQRVVAIGNALGQFQNTATEGIISGFGRSIQAGNGSGSTETLTNLIQTDAAINPGNSGGPLVTTAGEVIGMNTATASSAQNIGFAIPISEIKNQIKSVMQSGKIVRPYLGVRYVALTPEISKANNISVSYGAYISGSNGSAAIVSGSPAEKAGLREADIITKINNDKLDGTNSLQGILAKHNVGDEVTITYIRDGKTQTVKVKLQQAPTS